MHYGTDIGIQYQQSLIRATEANKEPTTSSQHVAYPCALDINYIAARENGKKAMHFVHSLTNPIFLLQILLNLLHLFIRVSFHILAS